MKVVIDEGKLHEEVSGGANIKPKAPGAGDDAARIAGRIRHPGRPGRRLVRPRSLSWREVVYARELMLA
jgi:hypothetical protein